jgi:PEP-CTERM motif
MRLLTSLIFLMAAGFPAMAEPITLSASSFPSGSYIFDWQFINGDQVVGNNTATISGFTASGVSLTSLQTFGTVTGAGLTGGLTLVDGPITEVQEAFTSSGAPWNIGFDVSYTGNYSEPGPGDALTFTITDTSLNPINSSGDGSLLEADITGPDSPLSTFAADPAFGSIQPEQGSTTVPEPSSIAVVGLAFLVVAGARQRRCRRGVQR